MPWSGAIFTRTDGTRSGADVFQRQATQSVTGGVAAMLFDLHANDMATGIQTCLRKDGGNPPTANLPMGGYQHTNVADATADNQYASLGQVNTLLAAPVAFATLTWTSPLVWDLDAMPRAAVVLTGNTSGITTSGGSDGGIYVLRLAQDATGGRTIVFPANWYWPDGGDTGVLSDAANAIDLLTVMRIGSLNYAILNRDWQT